MSCPSLTVSLLVAVPAVALLLLAATVVVVWKRVFPALRPPALVRQLCRSPWALVTAQAVCYSGLLVFSLPAFADLLPLLAVRANGGLLDTPPGWIEDGPRLYQVVVVVVAASLLVLGCLEGWRVALHRHGAQPGPWPMTLALVLSVPLYLVVFIEVLLLPIGHGLLRLPASREYTAIVVAFRKETVDADLLGRTFLLVDLKGAGPQRTLFCPGIPKVWAQVPSNDIELTHDLKKGSILGLLDEFKRRRDCSAEELRPVGFFEGG
jgi:hypothetical protein